MRATQYDYIFYIFRFYGYSFVDLIKCGVLTLMDDIRRYRNEINVHSSSSGKDFVFYDWRESE